MTKQFLFLLVIVCAIVITHPFIETTNATNLVMVQKMDSFYTSSSYEGQINRLERRDSTSCRYCQPSSRSEGRVYAGLIPNAYDELIEEHVGSTTQTTQQTQRVILETFDGFTETQPRRFRQYKHEFEIPDVEKDELPFIDEAGDSERNYGILLSAKWCRYCKKMYKVVTQLRDEGYRIYILDTDAFPEIKEKLNQKANNPEAPLIDDGVPWFIVRDKGQTIKMFKGATDIDKIRPHLVDYVTQLKLEKNTDYNFTTEGDHEIQN